MEDTEFVEFEDLKKEILVNITYTSYQVVFQTKSGKKFKLFHRQDCCESVYLADVYGRVEDILNKKILDVDSSSVNLNPEYGDNHYQIYRITTQEGELSFRFSGSSNGYYSTAVDFEVEMN
jgi:hypothetical protein